MNKKRFSALRLILIVFVIVLLAGIGVTGERTLREPVEVRTLRKQQVTQSDEGHQEYYFGLLNEDEQRGYREILEGIRSFEEKFYLSLSGDDEIDRVYHAVLKDHPEVFWVHNREKVYKTTYTGRDYCQFSPGYTYTEDERQEISQAMENAYQEVLAQIPEGADDYTKVMTVYTYIIDNTDYVVSDDDQSIAGTFWKKQAVCAGYAGAVQYLLERLNVPCIYVEGDAANSDQGHAWNIVQCNGQYYYVDATWGDPIFLGEDNGYQIPNLIAYDYLCCSEKELEKTHMISTDYVYPSCQSENLNYYQLNGMYYDTYEPGMLREVIDRSIESQEAYTIFKMSDDAVYQEVVDEMHETLMEEGAGYLGELYGLWQVSYSYSEEASLNKFIIYWFYE